MPDLPEPLPVCVFAAVLHRDATALEHAVDVMTHHWGPADAVSEPFPFTATDYYRDEMGADLNRLLVSFADPAPADSLPRLKHDAMAMEQALAGPLGQRTANIDVGYLDYHKVVLASTKEGRHKVYLSRGIWADMTLAYEKGAYHAFPWTFADFATDTYHPFLLDARLRYRHTLRDRDNAACARA